MRFSLKSIAAAIAATLAVAPAFALERGYKIDQYSALVGPHTLWVTPTAVKLVDINNFLSVMTSAPDWKVYYCNDKQKTFCETTPKGLEQAGGIKLFFVYRMDFVRNNWHTKPGKPIGGLPTVERTLEVTHGKLDGTPSSKNWVRGISSADSVEAAKFQVAPEIIEVLGKMLVVPPLTRLPLSFHFVGSGGGEKVALDTRKVERSVFTAKDFSVPQGYKKIKEQRLVAGSTTGGIFLENMSELYSDDKKEKSK